jgi:hypothetical protein
MITILNGEAMVWWMRTNRSPASTIKRTMLTVSKIKNTIVMNVILFRFSTFHFSIALVIFQCCQIWTTINAYHTILTMQWNDHHELSAEFPEIIANTSPTINNMSIIVFAAGLKKILFTL